VPARFWRRSLASHIQRLIQGVRRALPVKPGCSPVVEKLRVDGAEVDRGRLRAIDRMLGYSNATVP